MCIVNRTVGDVEDPVDALLTRMCGIGIHTLFDGVCRSGCRCTHAEVFLFLAYQVDFPLHPVSFRVTNGRAYCLFVSGDFVRDWVYYDLNDLNATVFGSATVVGRE
jgi:hypothetical protein